MILGDYHTHTIYSHGKGTVHENVEAARKAGLKEIAMSDHGPGHVIYSLKPKKMPKIFLDVQKEREIGDINVLLVYLKVKGLI